MAWIADRLATLWGNGAGWEQEGGTHPHEAHYLKLDCAKAKARLGWTPRWDLGRALTATVAWYQAERAGAEMRAVTLAQIEQFQESGA